MAGIDRLGSVGMQRQRGERGDGPERCTERAIALQLAPPAISPAYFLARIRSRKE